MKEYVKGKTANEIAEILTLSKRTVEHYLESIKIKFECSKKSEILQKLEHGNKMGLYLEIFN